MFPASEKVVRTPEELKARCRRSPHIILTGILLSLNWGLSGTFLIVPAYISSPEEINLANFTTIPDEFEGTESPFNLITSAFSLGNVIFFSFYGWLSDRYGRRMSVVSSVLGIGIGGILCAMAPNLKILLVCRFIQGIFYSPSTLINWVHLSESTPKKSHGVWAFVFGLSWIIGTSLIAPLVMISPSWRVLLLYLSFPNIFLAIFLYFYLQESLDYCVMNDDHKEVEQYVRRNLPAGCVVDMDTLTRVTSKAILEKERPVEKVYWYSILRNKKLLFILFASCYMSFAYTLVHNAMSLTSTVIEFGNLHVNFMLSALVELPSYAVVPLLFHLTGEKETLCILHVMTSISGVVIYFVSPGHWLYLSTWLFTKFASSSAFMCVLVFMSSKYPVEYRNSFVAISATLSNIAAVFAPQVYILETVVQGGMFLLFSLFTAAAVFLTIFIPKSI